MLRGLCGVAIGMAFLANSASAGFQFDIQTFDNGGNAQSTFFVGDVVRVRMFGVDTAGANPEIPPNSIIDFTASIVANTTDANSEAFGGPTGQGSISSRSTINPVFDLDDNVIGNDFTSGTGVVFTGNSTGFSTSSTQFLEFTYTAQQTTTFAFGSDVFQELGYTAGGPRQSLNGTDPSFTFSGATVTVSAVPEPSGLAFAGLLAGGLVLSRRRRSA